MIGRTLGLDYGTVRIGVAISDALGVTARPVRAYAAETFETDLPGIVDELGPTRVVIGRPVGLGGERGESMRGAERLAETVERVTGLEIVWADERFSSTRAEALLLDKERDRRKRREMVDAVAAAVILQGWLDARAADTRGNPRYAADPEA